MFKNVRLPGSQNVLHLGLKCSKSRRFLLDRGAPPPPAPPLTTPPPPAPAGEHTTLPRPPSREGLLAFGNRSFAPSALNPPLVPKNKNSRPVSPPNTKS